jgi:hypothetical protein
MRSSLDILAADPAHLPSPDPGPELLRLAGRPVPAISGPSGEVTWDQADLTDSVEAAGRGASADRRPGTHSA